MAKKAKRGRKPPAEVDTNATKLKRLTTIQAEPGSPLVDLKEDLEAYKQDGNLEFYTDENLDMRKQLRASPSIIGQLRRFFAVFDLDASASLSKEEVSTMRRCA